MPVMRTAFLALAALTLVLVVLQFFLAGLGIFGVSSFAAHESVGWILHLTTLLMLIAAAVGRLGRSAVIFGGVLFVLVVIQGGLAGARDDAPGLAAFHPLLALVIFMGSLQAFQYALAWRNERPAAAS